jgi:hypothetical protein
MNLQHSLAEILGQWLVDDGIGVAHTTAADWQTWVSNLPDVSQSRDNVLMTWDDGSNTRIGPRSQRTGSVEEKPGWQIRVRANGYFVGFDKMLAIVQAVDALTFAQVTLDATAYTLQNMKRTSGILYIGPEEDKKHLRGFTVNGIATVHLT